MKKLILLLLFCNCLDAQIYDLQNYSNPQEREIRIEIRNGSAVLIYSNHDLMQIQQTAKIVYLGEVERVEYNYGEWIAHFREGKLLYIKRNSDFFVTKHF